MERDAGDGQSPPFLKGDLGGFSNGIPKSPLTPLYERGEQIVVTAYRLCAFTRRENP